MKLQNLISLNTNYTRSINLERDADSFSIARSYIPTSRTLSTLSRIADTLNREDTPRSFALIGPYGSGKSAFAVFLAHLLGPVDAEGTKAARQVLQKADQPLCDNLGFHSDRTFGHLPVLITGTPEPFANRFVESLYKAAKTYWGKKRGPNHLIVRKLKQSTDNPLSIKEIMDLLSQLQDAVAKSGRGILIVFDELGKFLEYEARHYEANDIYLLQALAEHAYKGNEANLLVAVLMHQGFEQYARGLGETLRNEWSKVQGRYENIPFLESTEQTLRIVANAFQQELDKRQQIAVAKKCFSITAVLEKQNALPGVMAGEEAADLFKRCYPLHPVASLVLPILCQKLAQNERTLFSYLGSNEPHGLRDCIRKLENVGDFVSLWEIYEYFIRNQPAVLSDPSTRRRWAEVVTSLERLGDAPSEEIELVKTIGLLNIIGAHGGLKASETIVELCFQDKGKVQQALNALIQKSIIQFRKYSSEYRVWQGSDFDLETAVQDELNQVSHFSLPESLNDRKALPPIVARRHTIETGALRYFQSHFVDPVSYAKEISQSSMQRIIFCLVESRDDKKIFHKDIISYYSNQDIVVLCHNGDQLREATAEVLALERVQMNRPELHTDPVAMREYKDRLTAAEQNEDELLSAFIETPEVGEWYWKQAKFDVGNKRNLQQELSRILDKVYYKAPVFKNELINREKPSSQATAARNKLVSALLHNVDKEDLGIEKYPAERGVYLALLKATGLHREIDGKWQLASPAEDENPLNICPVWKKITDFLEETENKPQSFAELGPDLKAPPFGIKEGVLPILYATAFLCYQHELALYEDNVYTPYFTEQHLERFVKRPDYFTVQRFSTTYINASFFPLIELVSHGKLCTKPKSLLGIAGPLTKFHDELDDYTKHTSQLTEMCRRVMQAFALSQSPADLLFTSLPCACGFLSLNSDDVDKNETVDFAAKLGVALSELRDTYSNMVNNFVEILTKSLLPDIRQKIEISALRGKVKLKYEYLAARTVDVEGLQSFIQYLADAKSADDIWLQRLLLFLGGRVPQKWTDNEREEALLKLAQLSKRLVVLDTQHCHINDQFDDDFDFIRLQIMRLGHADCQITVPIDKAKKKFTAPYKEKVSSTLEKIEDDDMRLFLLSSLVEDCLIEKELTTNG